MFSIGTVFCDKMDLRLFYLWVTIYHQKFNNRKYLLHNSIDTDLWYQNTFHSVSFFLNRRFHFVFSFTGDLVFSTSFLNSRKTLEKIQGFY